MRVAKIIGPREIRLEEAPTPSPGRGEALVRVKAVGICGSDLQYYAQGRIGDQSLPAGHILGHEVAGVVEALGPEAEGPPPGTPVVVDPASPCGQCRFCLAGNPNLCRSLRFFGSPPTPGALCEFLVHPSRLLLPLSSGFAYSFGAAIEPLGVAIHAVDLGHIALGDRVAVFGCGPIGLLISRVAQLAGTRQVYVSEPLTHRRQAAVQFGAAVALDPSRPGAWYNLGLAAWRENRPEQAAGFLRTSLARQAPHGPMVGNTCYLLAQCLQALPGHAREARACARRAARLLPNSETAQDLARTLEEAP